MKKKNDNPGHGRPLLVRLRERLRYGLFLNELLTQLNSRIGLCIHPYTIYGQMVSTMDDLSAPRDELTSRLTLKRRCRLNCKWPLRIKSNTWK